MPSKNPAQRLRDILDNIDSIRTFTAQLDFSGFSRDSKTTYAVTRALEIISEAARRLPQDVRERHPGIDWAGISAAGNVYRKEYESVDDALIWHTVQTGLEPLRQAVSAELAKLN